MRRRDFLRWLVAGGVGGSVLAMSRRKCTNQGICGSCGSVQSCVLPQALSYRQVRGDRKVG